MRDKDVRNAVRQQLSQQHAGDLNTRIVEEMGVWSGSVRIDLAVINGELSGYELKSDRDTLERLPLQARLYSRVFDRVTLVASERHVDKALSRIPEWWGITVALEEADTVLLRSRRPSQPNPAQDPYLVAQFLWKEEALSVLASLGMKKGWTGKRLKEIHQKLASELPITELAAYVRNALKRRQNWLGQNVPDQFDMTIDADDNPTR